MKFQNLILNFERTHGQAQSNMPLQLLLGGGGGHKKKLKGRIS